jgi:predicted DNA-binding transcriptional regulator AlpA
MPEYLKDTEAAKILTLSEKTLRTWRQQGKGPIYLKLENSVRYTREELDRWAASRTVTPRPKPRGGQDSQL